jgi:hypothetical protein
MVDPVFELQYSDKKVTAWGGMRLMKEVCVRSRVFEELGRLDLPQPGSNRGYSAQQIIECFMVNVWLGLTRFSHGEYLRHDKALQEIFGWKRVPSASTYSRFFGKFNQARCNEVFPSLQNYFVSQLPLRRMTLDVDSTVLARYGQQEGVARGYNPGKPGRGSHHPLIAFIADTRMVANVWLRPGNTVALSNSEAFLEETLATLGPERVGLLRADSGFCSEKMLSYLESKNVDYIIAARFHARVKTMVRQARWLELDEGIEVCETKQRLSENGKMRRVVLVRKHTGKLPKSTGRQLELFGDEQDEVYRYSAYVTNLELPNESVWMLYRARGDAENRIKELKYDFGMDSYCLRNFWGSEAALRFIALAYNLMSVFRQIVLKQARQSTLSTLRTQCFAIGAWVSAHAGKRILKLAVSPRKRTWLDGLFSRADSLNTPFPFS